MVASLCEALNPLSDECRVICSGTPPYTILHTNKAWHKLTGYKFIEVAQRTNTFLQGPATEVEPLLQIQTNIRQGLPVKVKIVNYTKSGDPFCNKLEIVPLRDAHGSITHFCGVLSGEAASSDIPKLDREPLLPPLLQQHHDSTGETNAIGQASKRQKVRLADALSNTTDAVVLTTSTPPFNITHVNQPWCEMCGYSMEEVEGLTNSILQGPETDKTLVAELMSSVRRGEASSATLVNYKKGGVRFVNQVQLTPVYNEDDELEQFMAMLHEVDEAIEASPSVS